MQPCWSLLSRGREDLERVGVGQANDAEMSVIQGRDLLLADAFCHREHRGVDEAESQVGVGSEQFAYPHVV